MGLEAPEHNTQHPTPVIYQLTWAHLEISKSEDDSYEAGGDKPKHGTNHDNKGVRCAPWYMIPTRLIAIRARLTFSVPHRQPDGRWQSLHARRAVCELSRRHNQPVPS